MHYPRTGPRDPDLVSDLAFIGTAFKSRIEFFEQMDLDGIDFLLGGADWGSIDPASPLVPYVGSGLTEADCVDNAQTATLYRNALTGINFYRRESEDTWDGQAVACGPREIELAACGVPFLRDPRPESDQLFPMLPTFEGPGDASEKLRWMLSHEREREDMARQAREAVQTARSCTTRDGCSRSWTACDRRTLRHDPAVQGAQAASATVEAAADRGGRPDGGRGLADGREPPGRAGRLRHRRRRHARLDRARHHPPGR